MLNFFHFGNITMPTTYALLNLFLFANLKISSNNPISWVESIWYTMKCALLFWLASASASSAINFGALLPCSTFVSWKILKYQSKIHHWHFLVEPDDKYALSYGLGRNVVDSRSVECRINMPNIVWKKDKLRRRRTILKKLIHLPLA